MSDQPPGTRLSPPTVGHTLAPPYAGSVVTLPKSAYTPWSSRVLAWAVDIIPIAIVQGIGVGVLLGTQETACVGAGAGIEFDQLCASGASPIGQSALIATGVLSLVYWVWNVGYRQGTTGASIGKDVLNFRIVDEKSRQPVGFGMSVVREIIYWVIAGLCVGVIWLVAVLFPLWDEKRQTLVDKVLNHVALPN